MIKISVATNYQEWSLATTQTELVSRIICRRTLTVLLTKEYAGMQYFQSDKTGRIPVTLSAHTSHHRLYSGN